MMRCSSGHHYKVGSRYCPRCGRSGQPVARVHEAGTAEGWKGAVAAAALAALEGVELPLDGPIAVGIDFFFPRPKTFPKRIRDAYPGPPRMIPKGPLPHMAKPDRDNLEKAVLDALVAVGVLRDDCIVCDGTVKKFYHAEDDLPGAFISISKASRSRTFAKA